MIQDSMFMADAFCHVNYASKWWRSTKGVFISQFLKWQAMLSCIISHQAETLYSNFAWRHIRLSGKFTRAHAMDKERKKGRKEKLRKTANEGWRMRKRLLITIVWRFAWKQFTRISRKMCRSFFISNMFCSYTLLFLLLLLLLLLCLQW